MDCSKVGQLVKKPCKYKEAVQGQFSFKNIFVIRTIWSKNALAFTTL